jgi:hypothetical protein
MADIYASKPPERRIYVCIVSEDKNENAQEN